VTTLTRIRERLLERRNLKRLKRYLAQIPSAPRRQW